jgi:hypothetical protein
MKQGQKAKHNFEFKINFKMSTIKIFLAENYGVML